MRLIFTLLACGATLWTLPGCGQDKEQTAQPQSAPGMPLDIARLKPRIVTFCGDCHAVPNPETFPRQAWRREVERGFRFYAESGRSDLAVPSVDEIVAYYETLAPERLVVDPPTDEVSDGDERVRFHRGVSESPDLEPPAVSFLDWLRLPNQAHERLVFCDMRSGQVGLATTTSQNMSSQPLTTLNNPSRVALCDLDGDGLDEILVSELGSFLSEDHRRGAVVWLRWDPQRGAWRQRLLASGLGRVADVRGGDFDGDGDTDLVVASFGHLRTGGVLVYENLGLRNGQPHLRQRIVDERPGAIHVPVADLNADGRQDFVALISQEHETIEAYLNRGDFQFERKQIFAAGDPAYGSSGIDLVDLDGDGDLDVLYTNGDTFGSDYLKPYHGISWLQNKGSYPFLEGRLADMVGVQRAVPADLDGDRDLDVVASGFLPQNLVTFPELAEHDSLLWLEQTQRGQFIRHSLEKGSFLHAALMVADIDQDGDTDLAVGNFQNVPGPHDSWFSVWWNATKKR